MPNSSLTYLEFTKNVNCSMLAKYIHPNLDPVENQIVIYYFGSVNDGNQIKLQVSYKVTKLGSGVLGSPTVTTSTLDITNSYSRATLFSIASTDLEKESIISFELKRDAGDTYSGDFGLMFVKRVQGVV